MWVRFWSPYTLVNLFLLSSRKFLPLLMPTLQQTLSTDLTIDDRPTRVLPTSSFQGVFTASDNGNDRNERRQRLILSSTTYAQWTIDLWKRRVLIYEWQEYTGGQATISCPSSWPTPGERWRSLLVTCSSSIWRLSESKDVPVYHCHLEHPLSLLDSDVGCSLA